MMCWARGRELSSQRLPEVRIVVALQGRKLRPRGLDLTGRARIGSAPRQFGATASSLQLEKRFSLLTWLVCVGGRVESRGDPEGHTVHAASNLVLFLPEARLHNLTKDGSLTVHLSAIL